MKVSSLKATAFFTAAAFAASVGVASAVPLTAQDAKCRSTIAKNSGKVMSTLSKAYDKCIKTALKSGSGTCNNTATADPGGKAAKAKTKVGDGITKSCPNAAMEVAATLGEHEICGTPIGTAITDIASVGTCLNSLVDENVARWRNAILTPRYAEIAASPAVKEITKGGAHVSIDALGHPATCFNSIANLRRRGRHVQVGLMVGDHARAQVPMAQIIAHELEVYGSHGMQAFRYQDMMAMIRTGKLAPQKLVGKHISLDEAPDALMAMDRFEGLGISVITRF